MPQNLKVLLLIPHLGGGGAEKVAALLAGGLSREKYEVHLGLITQSSTEPDALPSWVAVHALGAKRIRRGAIRLLILVRRLKPDVILSGTSHVNFLVLLLRLFFPGRRACSSGRAERFRPVWPLEDCRGIRRSYTGSFTAMPTGLSASRRLWRTIFHERWESGKI